MSVDISATNNVGRQGGPTVDISHKYGMTNNVGTPQTCRSTKITSKYVRQKMHHFMFAIALSELSIMTIFGAHILQ